MPSLTATNRERITHDHRCILSSLSRQKSFNLGWQCWHETRWEQKIILAQSSVSQGNFAVRRFFLHVWTATKDTWRGLPCLAPEGDNLRKKGDNYLSLKWSLYQRCVDTLSRMCWYALSGEPFLIASWKYLAVPCKVGSRSSGRKSPFGMMLPLL